MMTHTLQLAIVAIVVAVAAVYVTMYTRRSARDGCSNCPLADACNKKQKKDCGKHKKA